MKFTLSLLAALLGVVSASGHNGSANGTATTPVSGGGGGGGANAAVTTPASTTNTTTSSGVDTAGKASFKSDIAATVDIGNLTSSDVTSATSSHSASSPYTPASCGSDGLGITCKFLTIVQEAAKTVSGDSTAAVYGIGTAAARRRSLSDKDEGRRLSSVAFSFSTMQVYATDSAAKAVFDDASNFATKIAEKATADGSLTVTGISATMVGTLTTTGGLDYTAADSTGATSSAFKMGASALAVVFSVVSLF